jgi:hypothetical protein
MRGGRSAKQCGDRVSRLIGGSYVTSADRIAEFSLVFHQLRTSRASLGSRRTRVAWSCDARSARCAVAYRVRCGSAEGETRRARLVDAASGLPILVVITRTCWARSLQTDFRRQNTIVRSRGSTLRSWRHSTHWASPPGSRRWQVNAAPTVTPRAAMQSTTRWPGSAGAFRSTTNTSVPWLGPVRGVPDALSLGSGARGRDAIAGSPPEQRAAAKRFDASALQLSEQIRPCADVISAGSKVM